MKFRYSRGFIKSLERLPRTVRQRYVIQESIFKNNWRDPRLQTKQLHTKPITFSFRITRQYRAIFYFAAQGEVVLVAIGHRKEVYD
ncbi:hypothetical protein HYZ64_02980 [Candidatus Berkelbacteria bacterium]|nr:hypothetical protein [Candidatus Berkelbacteria bacterium]